MARIGSSFEALIQRSPVLIALAFEGGLGALALLLALVFGVRPWLAIDFGVDALSQSLLATVPPVAAILVLMRRRWQWVERLDRLVRQYLLPLFRDAGPTAVFAVALMAGIGEELLFRGLIQAGLSDELGLIGALAVASLLFGLVHAVTKVYFLMTCLMGLYLGWLYLVTGNLLVPVLVHFLYDWIVLSWYLSHTRGSY
ncbi:MAG: CPBP family intramembrane glutamic endopeptidase [Wenzhouxiangellaceae bacterium]|nr:CPBP family intramembrane glutamic endopeptidase [Wenzhouxiangellaceae bacterium]